MTQPSWRDIALTQSGLITRAQLAAVGVRRWQITHYIDSERWQLLSPKVVAVTTGELTAVQRQWHAVLHAGRGALIGGLAAAEMAGLRNWTREEITVFVPYANEVPPPLPGVTFVRSRRDLAAMRAARSAPPRLRLEPAILLFAAADRSERTAQGLLAAAVQQRLTTPESLLGWVDRLSPLRRARMFRRVLIEIAGGAQSLAELDIRRFCRRHGFSLPRRQVKRRDAAGRIRFTDCEWDLPGGVVLVLEIDGSFHMEVEHWQDDIVRQRALTQPGRIVIRCTAGELRDDDGQLARDLGRLGIPRAA